MFKGVFTALPTPFRAGGVDVAALEAMVARQLAAGIHGLVACGTTGESPTLDASEWALVVKTVVKAGAKSTVIAGTGSNDTRVCVKKTVQAAELGAAGALVVVPYYNKPTQAGMLAHFRTVADESPIPIIMYNIPGRTSVNMLPETAAELAGHKRIVAIKEASGSLDQMSRLLRLTRGTNFSVLSGDDSLTLPLLAAGGAGVISTNSNVVPEHMVRMYQAHVAGDVAAAAAIHLDILELTSLLFVESNPAPLKYALSQLGLCTEDVRLPLVALSEKFRAPLRGAMKDLGLLK